MRDRRPACDAPRCASGRSGAGPPGPGLAVAAWRPGGTASRAHRARRRLVPLMAALLAPCAAAHAQRLDLSVTPTTIAFPSSSPDVAPVLLSVPVEVTYRVQQNLQRPWTLTLLALGDLSSGTSTIEIANVSWVATPAPPFQNGTLSRTVAQRLAAGTGNVTPAAYGQITFRLPNAWTYDAGVYTQVVTFTLSAP